MKSQNAAAYASVLLRQCSSWMKRAEINRLLYSNDTGKDAAEF